MGNPSQANLDNHANQCNPNNDEYWHSRGYEDREDAEQQINDEYSQKSQKSTANNHK